MRNSKSNTQISRPTDKELKKILNDPLEFWRAMERYYKKQKYNKLQAIEQQKREEYYVKYGELVFEIFDVYTYRRKSEIMETIKIKLHSSYTKVEELFNVMEEYLLIEPLRDDNFNQIEDIFKIHWILSYGEYESQIKLIRKEWLQRNNKVLIDNLNDYLGSF